jgi:hypothetical protein
MGPVVAVIVLCVAIQSITNTYSGLPAVELVSEVFVSLLDDIVCDTVRLRSRTFNDFRHCVFPGLLKEQCYAKNSVWPLNLETGG